MSIYISFLLLFSLFQYSGQPNKFEEALENFEDYVNKHAPVIITNPNVDPYVVGNCALNKCGWTFSKLDELAKWQYQWPLQFAP